MVRQLLHWWKHDNGSSIHIFIHWYIRQLFYSIYPALVRMDIWNYFCDCLFIFTYLGADWRARYGRKKILIACAFGMGLSIFLMGFVQNVWQLFLLRMFMGIFTGFISMSQAFISTQTPKEIAGRVLGTLQTGNITGSLFGPLIGGILADTLGYSTAFKFTSITIFISGLLVFATREYQVERQKGTKTSYTSREVLSHILRNPILVNVMLISTLVQVAHFSIQPILSLYVGELHGTSNLGFYSGIAFSAAGLGNLLMARHWGKIGDRHGHVKILVLLLFLTALVYLPGAFINHFWQLVFVRFILGMAIGGIIPVRIAYIRQEAPVAMQGEVLGYNTSLRFLGNIIGPRYGRNGRWLLWILSCFHHDQHLASHRRTCPLCRDAPQSRVSQITLITFPQNSLLPIWSRLFYSTSRKHLLNDR